MPRQDGTADATSETTGLESGGMRTRDPVRVESEELVTELPLELAATGRHWSRRTVPERRHPEGLNQRRLAAPAPIGRFVQLRLETDQCAASGFNGLTQASVELRAANGAARGLVRRVEFLKFDGRRELLGEQLLEICHHLVHKLSEGAKGARLLGPSRVVGLSSPTR